MQLSKATMIPPLGFGNRILDTLKSALLCLDCERRITYVNATCESLFENSAANLVGRPFDSLLSSTEPSTISEKLALEPISMTEHEAVITLANGKSFIADYSIYPDSERDPDSELLLEIRLPDRQAQIAREEFNQLQQLARQQLARGTSKSFTS